MSSVSLERTSTESSDFRLLITELDSALFSMYGDEMEFFCPLNKVENLPTALVARDAASGEPLGCCCFKPRADLGSFVIELKRMFVREAARGRGVGKVLLAEVEKWASEMAVTRIVLETGPKNTAAVAMYKKSGFRVLEENFPPYVGSTSSICMEKKI